MGTSPSLDKIASYRMPGQQDLPANTAPWQPDPARAVLLVHDMQRYFLRPFSADEEPASTLVTNASALVAGCREEGIPVAYTAQPGGMTSQQRGLLNDFWGPGMTTTAEDREVIDELAPDEQSALFTKWRYSAFFGNELRGHLRSLGRDQLVICGVYAHVGVLATAVDAFTHDIQAFVVADAVADFSEQQHRMAIEYAATRCAVVITTGTVLSSVAGTGRATP